MENTIKELNNANNNISKLKGLVDDAALQELIIYRNKMVCKLDALIKHKRVILKEIQQLYLDCKNEPETAQKLRNNADQLLKEIEQGQECLDNCQL